MMPVSRRRLLLTGVAGAAGLVVKTPSQARPAAPARIGLGRWYETPSGLPAYEYTGPVPAMARDKTGADAEEAPDPSFILGNYRLTAFAHVSGVLQILTGERAWARVNAAEAMNYAEHAAAITLGQGSTAETLPLIGLDSLATDPKRTRRRFGPGFARHDYRLGEGLALSRTVSVRPSRAINTGDATLTVALVLTNDTAVPLPFGFREQLGRRYVLAGQQRQAEAERTVRYPSSVVTAEDGRIALSVTRFEPVAFSSARAPDESAPYDVQPVSLFLHVDAGPTLQAKVAASDDDRALEARVEGVVPARGSVSFALRIGLTYGGIEDAAAQARSATFGAEPTRADGAFAGPWREALPDFAAERDPVFRVEMGWNAYVLEAMATYSAYFAETLVPQGMIYSWEDGENISNRDHLQALLPLCRTNPALARSSLLHVIKQTTATGEIERGTGGFGYVSPGVYKESDAQLNLFMALGEYWRATADYDLLDQTVAYYPQEHGSTDTVLRMLERHFVYLRDEVGRGVHGLIRILNSDWSDSFFHRFSPNITLGAAESHLNSAMAAAVLPRFVAGLRASGRPDAGILADAVDAFRAEVSRAYLADLGQRGFSARAYLNNGMPSYGLDTVCLEPQGFLLQMAELDAGRKRQIYTHVKAATYTPEKVGFRIRETPLWGGIGEGEDGALWPALEGQMVLGVASFDTAEARALLKTLSFDHFAKTYPDYWMGRWTHFDSIQSTLSPREGLLNYWRKTYRDCSYGFCSHVHSWPLFNYLTILDREAEAGS